MPGFTHLQVAQPVTFGHHLLAYDAMLARDVERFADCRKRVNRLPLGSAALAGTSFPIDRDRVARELGFDGVSTNSLDAVSDRDFAIEFAAAAALVMMHLSRFAEELVLWSSPRFGFVRLADRFCTGSSIMPQKKNPDVPELVRGKTGRVIGHLMALLALMKGQPLAYNKDNQEDKEPLFDTVDTLADTLAIMTDLVGDGHRGRTPSGCAPRRAKATPRRPTSPTTWCARACRFATRTKPLRAPCAMPKHAACDLAALPLADLRAFSPLIGDDVFDVLTLEGSVASRDHPGGTAPAQVRAAIARRARCASSRADAHALDATPRRLPHAMAQHLPGADMNGKKLAFLGLGVMGYPMAGHLAKRGPRRHRVQPHRRQGRASGSAQHGGQAAPTPAAAARDADIVMMCVGNDDDVRAVASAPTARSRRCRAARSLVDHTTASAEVAREMHAPPRRRAASASSMRRCRAARRAPRTAS